MTVNKSLTDTKDDDGLCKEMFLQGPPCPATLSLLQHNTWTCFIRDTRALASVKAVPKPKISCFSMNIKNMTKQ